MILPITLAKGRSVRIVQVLAILPYMGEFPISVYCSRLNPTGKSTCLVHWYIGKTIIVFILCNDLALKRMFETPASTVDHDELSNVCVTVFMI